MKYYKFEVCNNSYYDCDENYYVAIPDELATTNYLIQEACEYCQQNGEDYEWHLFGWDTDPIEDLGYTEDEVEDIIEEYYDEISCDYKEITKEEYEENS